MYKRWKQELIVTSETLVHIFTSFQRETWDDGNYTCGQINTRGHDFLKLFM
jgi:hypothetical protein